MKIWAVCQGAYENWWPLEFFYTEDDAQGYAAIVGSDDIRRWELHLSVKDALKANLKKAQESDSCVSVQAWEDRLDAVASAPK